MSNPYIPKSHIIYTIAVIGFIYVLHEAIPIYSNSSFLSLFTDERTVGLIYMTGSAFAVFGFLFIPYVIKKLGNYTTSLWLVCIQIALFAGLISTNDINYIVPIFIAQTAVVALIGLTLDIFLETYTDGAKVGSIRGLYGAVLNASWVIAPLLGSMLINGNNNYHNTYVAGLAMLFPLLYLIYRNFPRFKDPHYDHPSPHQLLKHIIRDKNWVKLFSINIVLQTFYSWMTIYSTIYLNRIIGFGWEEIGVILFVMLMPFPLIQYPLGRISDKLGEKRIMALGFTIMGIATAFLSLISIKSVIVWAIALFLTRIGAAAAEVMIETYFFKTVSAKDSSILGAFRITRPISYFIAPLVMGASLFFMTDKYVFIVVGAICILTVWPIMKMREIR